MHCEKFESRLNELLDEREPLELDAAMRAHQRHCTDCRRLYAAYRKFMHAVRCSALPEPSAGVSERIVETLLAEAMPATSREIETARPSSRAGRSRRWLWRAAALVVSAAVLLAVALRFSGFNTPQPRGPENANIAVSHQTEAVELSALARDAASRYLGLARETRREVSGAFSLLPRMEAPASLLEDGIPLRRDPAEIAMNVADTLKPLARSTVDTFGFLFGPPRAQNGGM